MKPILVQSLASRMEFFWKSASSDGSEPSVTISSWIVQFAEIKKLQYADSRAPGIPCYNPEYTFVEKVQAVVRKYGEFKGTGKSQPISSDTTTINQLLDVDAVQKFIGTAEYLEHKRKRFKSLNQDVAKSGAFTLQDENIRNNSKPNTQRPPHSTIAGRSPSTRFSHESKKTSHVCNGPNLIQPDEGSIRNSEILDGMH